MSLPKTKIPVVETFFSIQGEGINIGKPYYFIRVGGCPLRCNFCDSEYTWKIDSVDSIIDVEELCSNAISYCQNVKCDWISITGGEPLLYPEQLLEMIRRFDSVGIKTHIETSGRFYDIRVHQNCDLYSPDVKSPSTGECDKSYLKWIQNMRSEDQVKVLIADQNDFDFAYQINKLLKDDCTLILQPFNENVATDSITNMREVKSQDRYKSKDVVPLVDLRYNLCSSLRDLIEMFLSSQRGGQKWFRTIVTPQIHVLAFGNKAGI